MADSEFLIVDLKGRLLDTATEDDLIHRMLTPGEFVTLCTLGRVVVEHTAGSFEVIQNNEESNAH